MEHSEDSHVEKIWHNSDITKNWIPEVAEIFLQDLVMYYMRHSSYVSGVGWHDRKNRTQ